MQANAQTDTHLPSICIIIYLSSLHGNPIKITNTINNNNTSRNANTQPGNSSSRWRCCAVKTKGICRRLQLLTWQTARTIRYFYGRHSVKPFAHNSYCAFGRNIITTTDPQSGWHQLLASCVFRVDLVSCTNIGNKCAQTISSSRCFRGSHLSLRSGIENGVFMFNNAILCGTMYFIIMRNT